MVFLAGVGVGYEHGDGNALGRGGEGGEEFCAGFYDGGVVAIGDVGVDECGVEGWACGCGREIFVEEQTPRPARRK